MKRKAGGRKEKVELGLKQGREGDQRVRAGYWKGLSLLYSRC